MAGHRAGSLWPGGTCRAFGIILLSWGQGYLNFCLCP